MTIIFTRDSLRASVEAATGGKVTVLYDDKGYPSYMCVIPKFNIQDVDPGSGMGTGVHPAFIVDGVEKSEIFIGQYPAVIKNNRAVSLPGEDPAASLDYDAAMGYCQNKGPGWHLMTNWEWAAVALWCLANGFQPRGNTYYGRHHTQAHEAGVRQNGLTPGTASGPAHTLTGSGPASWRHTGDHAGICELVGNVWEWVGGFKLSEGRIYMPSDNNITLADAQWPATSVFLDGTADGSSGEVGAVQLATSVSGVTSEAGFLKNSWITTAHTTEYASLSAAIRQKMQQACIDPAPDTANPVGSIWAQNHEERMPLRGGSWDDTGDAGLFALALFSLRSDVSSYYGFRPAFIQ